VPGMVFDYITNAGIAIPEPSSLLLFGNGFAGRVNRITSARNRFSCGFGAPAKPARWYE
jgi:hypothetical protein